MLTLRAETSNQRLSSLTDLILILNDLPGELSFAQYGLTACDCPSVLVLTDSMCGSKDNSVDGQTDK